MIRLKKQFDYYVSSILLRYEEVLPTYSHSFIAHSGTTHAQTLITALFNQTDEDRLRKDFSYDFYDGEGVSYSLRCSIGSIIDVASLT